MEVSKVEGKVESKMEGKMEGVYKDVDIRHPSINTEPRTLNECTMERAMVAAQMIYSQHPEPSSDCFTKDATDSATRENLAPADDAPDALRTHLDELVEKAGNVINTNFTQSKTQEPSETPAAPPSEPSAPPSDPSTPPSKPST